MNTSKNPIKSHAIWTKTMWMGGGDEWTLKDQAIMSLGLAAESLEVLEVVFAEGDLHQTDACKELGDAIFYWCIVCAWIGVDPENLWPSGPEPVVRLKTTEEIRKACAQMCIAFGKASECSKKILRDGDDYTRLTFALALCAKSWQECCASLGLNWIVVLEINKKKLEGRLARGTLGGSGNDR